MIPDYPTFFWFSAVAALIFVGIGKAGFGGGVGIVATPLMALTIPVAEAAALLLPLLIIMDIFSITHYRNTFDRASLTLLLPGALVGIAIGGFFFGYFADNEMILRQGVGVLALLFVAYQAGRFLILGALEETIMPPAIGVLVGGVSGFTSTIAHAGGPPASIYLLPQKLPQQIFVGTTVLFFTVVNATKLIPYGMLGLLKVGNVTTILLLAPFAYLGVRLGIFLNGRVSQTLFTRVVYTILFLTGIQLLTGWNPIQWLLG
jgi:uncharacterized membrane protein YfcA